MDKEYNSPATLRKRLVAVFLLSAVLFCALFGRLGYIQIFQGKDLQARAAEQWYRDLPLVAPRGKILDRNGDILADNMDVYTVYVRPKAVKQPERVASSLASALGVDYDKLISKIKAASVSEITVAKQVSPSVARPLIEQGMDGVYFTVDSKRNYPGGNFLTQVMGYTNIDNVGQNGLEAYYETYLKGVNGFAYTPTDIKGVEREGGVTKYVPAIPGSNITLTIDMPIQSFAAEAVMAAQKEFSAKSASMIILDAKDGGVLAMAMTPSFDLNDVPREDIDILNALSKNTMLVDVFEPGSTFKIFTTATALEHGVGGGNRTHFCPGYRIVDGQRIKCWRYKGHGSQFLDQGVKNSCNCVFMDLALSLGTERLYDGLESFGFGQKSGIDFSGESRGLMLDRKAVKNIDLARIGFGQAVAVTPLQLAAGVAAAVNGGMLYQPHFLKSVSTYDGKTYYNHETKTNKKAISGETSAKMRELLEGVVSDGSGRKAQVAGFKVGGKTGTAQKYANGVIAQGKYISSFVGFAPADDPQYVAVMIVDEPGGYVYYGSLVAAPYVGQVFKKIFDYKGIKGQTPIPEAMIEMPELVGKTFDEAQKILDSFGLKFEVAGEGETVIGTVPVATEKLPVGDIVLLRVE